MASMESKNIIALGIETSCDETSAAIVTGDRKILSNVLRTQLDFHERYGGVVPEIAARLHMDILDELISQSLYEAKISFEDISVIAGTGGPGLIGGVIVGTMMSKAISLVRDIPYVAVNHLAGHALTVRLTDNIQFPYLLLLMSGGHCQILLVKSPVDFQLLGQTQDDAIGEAFDKTGRLLGLGYPSGPHIEKLALGGNPKAYKFPRPLISKRKNNDVSPYDFSLSGLKTAVRRAIEIKAELSEIDKADICASFQEAIGDILVNRAANALQKVQVENIVLAGGVAANQYLRGRLSDLANCCNVSFIAPPIGLCSDNAAMIAWAGIERYRLGLIDDLDFAPRPRWSLEEENKREDYE